MQITAKPNINVLIATFHATKSDEDFSALYESFRTSFRRRLRSDTRSTGGDEAEVQALYDDCVWKEAQAWSPGKGDFETMVNARIKLRKIDLYRKSKRRQSQCSYDEMVETNSDGEAATEPTEASGNEDPAIKKKATDLGRQALIDHLLHPATDDLATMAVVAAVKTIPFESATSLGKAIGVHHEIVKRRLRSLASRYDESRFGPLCDYLSAV